MAHTGPAALAAALGQRPDVILLDIGLPEWDGYEVAKRIRQEPQLRDTVLVAITGYERKADRRLLQRDRDEAVVGMNDVAAGSVQLPGDAMADLRHEFELPRPSGSLICHLLHLPSDKYSCDQIFLPIPTSCQIAKASVATRRARCSCWLRGNLASAKSTVGNVNHENHETHERNDCLAGE